MSSRRSRTPGPNCAAECPGIGSLGSDAPPAHPPKSGGGAGGRGGGGGGDGGGGGGGGGVGVGVAVGAGRERAGQSGGSAPASLGGGSPSRNRNSGCATSKGGSTTSTGSGPIRRSSGVGQLVVSNDRVHAPARPVWGRAQNPVAATDYTQTADVQAQQVSTPTERRTWCRWVCRSWQRSSRRTQHSMPTPSANGRLLGALGVGDSGRCGAPGNGMNSRSIVRLRRRGPLRSCRLHPINCWRRGLTRAPRWGRPVRAADLRSPAHRMPPASDPAHAHTGYAGRACDCRRQAQDIAGHASDGWAR